MGLDFYNKLDEIAKRLGFTYIGGSNNEKNHSFFLNKLGRKSLNQFPQLWKAFGFSEQKDKIGDYVTFKAL